MTIDKITKIDIKDLSLEQLYELQKLSDNDLLLKHQITRFNLNLAIANKNIEIKTIGQLYDHLNQFGYFEEFVINCWNDISNSPAEYFLSFEIFVDRGNIIFMYDNEYAMSIEDLIDDVIKRLKNSNLDPI